MQFDTRAIPRVRRLAAVCLATMLLSVSPTAAKAGQLVTSLSSADVDTAIQLAGDERTLRKFLDTYTIQLRAGWGSGPLIGVFTTPFSRVVRAAAAARKNKEVFSASDVTPEMTAPEVHVIATVLAIAPGETELATVDSVFISPLGTRSRANSILPLRTTNLTPEYQRRYGLTSENGGVIAVFPLNAVSRHNWMHVVFSRVVRSLAAVSACKECAVPFPAVGIR
jgi:hypothetical protein